SGGEMVNDQRQGPDFPPGFQDVSVVGTGAVATVYRAREEALDRVVAVKLFNNILAPGGGRTEFARECATAARLAVHPGIVQVYSAGLTPGGRPYLCMRLVAGGSLATALTGGPLPPERALSIGAVVADTLAWAHGLESPVLHCDVKPGNILLDEQESPLLGDFGISTRLGAGRSSVTVDQLTQSYAAPEVLFHGRYSAAAEVWS